VKHDDEEDSLFVSEEDLEEASDQSFSDKKAKKTPYAKWVQRSKKVTLKQK
jgi:hypothetical protein